MARFHFALQKLLNLRKHQEDQKAIELKKAQLKLFKAQDKFMSIEEQRSDALKRPSGSMVDINMERVHRDYLRQLTNQSSRLRVEVEMNERDTEARRKELALALKDRKAVERLREKRLIEFKKEIYRKEAIQENEVALRISTRNN